MKFERRGKKTANAKQLSNYSGTICSRQTAIVLITPVNHLNLVRLSWFGR